MDELTIDGKTYISSKKAAAITGYAKDYVGQLCREGRVEARLVGRSWYVYEPSLETHRLEDGRKSSEPEGNGVALNESTAEKRAEGGEEQTPESTQEKDTLSSQESVQLHVGEKNMPSSDKASIQAVWEEPRYVPEPPIEMLELAPEVDEKEQPPQDQVSEMQSAWQEWFSSRPQYDVQEEVKPTKITEREEEPIAMARQEHEPTPNAAEPIPMRRIVSDISPKMPSIAEQAPVAAASSFSQKEASVEQKEEKRSPSRPIHERDRDKSYVLHKALIAAFILVVASITFVATGVAHSLHLTGLVASPFFSFLEGLTEIK